MRILAINPCLRPESPRYILPMGLAYILTALKSKGYDFELLDLDLHRPSDEWLENYFASNIFDVYLMGCIVTGYRYVKKYSRMIRRSNPNAKIVVGNSVASSIPERLLRNTDSDFVVFGEGDESVPELIEVFRNKKDLESVPGIGFIDNNGNFKRTNGMHVIEDLDTLAFPDWELFEVDKYNEKSGLLTNEPCPIPFEERVCMQVNTARGCPFSCTFCYTVYFDEGLGKGNRYRMRSPASIVAEIKDLQERYGLNYVNFWDDLTFPNWKITEQFMDAFLDAGLKFYWNATVRGGLLGMKQLHVAEKMKAAGCVGLSYSLESANDKIRQLAINKHLPLQTFVDQKAVLDAVGISTWTNLIIGYPQETEETLKESFDFCYEQGIYPSTGFLLPMPGTWVWDEAVKRGYITDEEEFIMTFGDRQDLFVNMTQIPTPHLLELVEGHLMRINEKLNLGLDKSSLIKTTMKRDVASRNDIKAPLARIH